MNSSYIFLFPSKPYINLPEDFLGFLIWFVYIFLLALLIYKFWEPFPNRRNKKIGLFYILAILAPIMVLFGGVNFGGDTVSPIAEQTRQILLLLSSLPWQLAAGFFGALPAVIIGLLTGISTAIWGTHNIFRYSRNNWNGFVVLLFYSAELPIKIFCNRPHSDNFCYFNSRCVFPYLPI